MNQNILLFVFSLIVFNITCINIPLCSSGAVNVLFKDTQGVSDSTTRASLCHDKKKLYVDW